MLLANRTVATFVGKTAGQEKSQRHWFYRVHDVPDPSRLADLKAANCQNIRPTKSKASGNPKGDQPFD